MTSQDTIIIHGQSWELSYNIASCISRDWKQQRWSASGSAMHGHCEICWWDFTHSIGYTDGLGWICNEFYHRFIETRV